MYNYTRADLGEQSSICIEDMCGYASSSHYPVQYWADWDGELVIFGGDWSGIPSMPTPDGTVTQEQVQAWVDEHLEKENASSGKENAPYLPD